MKNTIFNRLISMLLAASLTLSMNSSFAFAAEGAHGSGQSAIGISGEEGEAAAPKAMLSTATAPGVSIEIDSISKLNTAIKGAKADTSFVLTQNIIGKSGGMAVDKTPVVIADGNNYNFTIDLNGHRFESPEDTYLSAIEHLGEGTLTIMDSSPGQTGVITSENDYQTIKLSAGKLVVNGGTVSNTRGGSAISGSNIKSTIEVNGGNVVTTSTGSGIYSGGTVNIKSGTVNGGRWSNAIEVSGGGTANISGGIVTGSCTFNSQSIEIGTIELYGKGCTLNISGGRVENTQSEYGGGAAIYSNNDNNKVNITGGTVSAVKCYAIHVRYDLVMTISGEDTLITSKAYEEERDGNWNSTIRLEGSTAVISGGTVQNTSGGNAIYNSGNLTISGGTVENTGTVADPRNDYDDAIYTTRSFTVEGSAIVQSPNGYAIKIGNYEKKVIIPSGSPVIRGTPPMVNDPDTSEYTNCRISASKSYDGTDLIRYVPGSSPYYKYMTFIESIQSPIDVAFADGTAVYNGAAQGYEKATCAENDVAMTYTYTPKAGSSLTKGLPKNVGTYTVKATYDSNTHLGSKEATFTITPAPLTIADYTVSDREYDGTDAANIAVTFGGLQGGETLTIGDKNDYKVTDAKFAQKNVSDQPIAVTGTAVLNDTAKAKNYTLAKGELKGKTAKISKCALYGATVIEGKGQKDYDGTKIFTDVPVKYFNYGSSETVTGTVSGTVGRADAGKDKELAVTEWKLDSAFAGNYTVPKIKTVNGKVEILPIDPIITIEAPISQKPGTDVTVLVKVTNPEGATEGYPGYWDVSLAVDGNATVKTKLQGVTGKPGEYTATYTLASNVPEGTLVTFTAKLPQATTNYNANTTGTEHKVAIREKTVAVTGVALNKANLSLEVGKSETLTATVAPANATYKAVTWSSGTPAVATVDEDGKVTAVAAGTATITVTTTDGGKKAACAVTVTAPPVTVAVTGVALNKANLSLEVGKSETLTATVAPANATNKAVTWSSGTPAVATVDKDGKVTAVAAGTATITVTTTDGSKTATCAVTVTAPPVTVAVTGVTLNKTNLSLEVGKSEALTATIAPATATNKAVTWESDAPAVATVDEDGKVKAVVAGTATITVTTTDGGKTATCAVTVAAAVIKPAPGGELTAPLTQDKVDDVFGEGNTTLDVTTNPPTIHLENSITPEKPIEIETDVEIDLGGNTITGKPGQTPIIVGDGDKVTIDGDGTVSGGDNSSGIGGNGITGGTDSDITIGGGVTVEGGDGTTGGDGIQNGGNVNVDGSVSGGNGSSGNGGDGVDTSGGSGNITIGSDGSATGGNSTGGNGNGGNGTSSGGDTIIGGDATGGNGNGSGSGGNGTTTGSGDTTISGGGSTSGGSGGSSSSGTGGNGGSGSTSTGGGSIDVSGETSGGAGGNGATGGAGGNGTSTGGSTTVNGGGSTTGGSGGSGSTVGGNGGDGTSSGNTEINGGATGGSGGNGTPGTNGNGGNGGNGANQGSGTVDGSGTVTGGNGGSGSGSGTGGNGGSGVGGGAEPGDNLIVQNGISAKVEVVGDAKTEVKLPDPTKTVDAVLTDAEKADKDITDVKVTLKVDDKTAAKPDQAAVESEKPANSIIGAFFDITLQKTITKNNVTGSPELVTDVPNGVVTITIEIPSGMLDGVENSYVVIRVHNGIGEALLTKQFGNKLTFETDKFSTYAIAYTKSSTPPGPPTDDTSDGGSSDSGYNFWMDVKDSIEHAVSGDVIKVNAGTNDRMPADVMETLKQNQDVSLVISHSNDKTITIPAGKAVDKEPGRIYWPLSKLAEIYAGFQETDVLIPVTQTNPETGGPNPYYSEVLFTPVGGGSLITVEAPVKELQPNMPVAVGDMAVTPPDAGFEADAFAGTPDAKQVNNGNARGVIALMLAAAAVGSGVWFWKRHEVDEQE